MTMSRSRQQPPKRRTSRSLAGAHCSLGGNCPRRLWLLGEAALCGAPDRQRHYSFGGLRKRYWRSCIRRHAETGSGCAASAVAISESGFRPADLGNHAVHGAFAERARRRCRRSGGLSAAGRQGGFSGCDQELGKPSIPHSSLAIDNSLIGSYETALEESKAVIRLAPHSAFGYGNLALAHQGLNHWKESRSALEQLVTIGAESQAYCGLFVEAFAQGDQPAMQKYLEVGDKKIQASDMPTFQFNQAGVATFEGKLRTARELVDTAVRSADQVGLKQNQPAMQAQEARWEAQIGNLQRANEQARSVAKNAHGIDVELNASLALALTGDLQAAERLADDLERTHAQDTILNAVSMPLIRSTIALQRGNPQQALELLKLSERYELGIGLYYFPALMPTYIRGQAYLKMQDGTKAALEFQKILDHRGSGPTSLNYVLAQLGLGRANAIAGNVAGAKVAYRDFLTLWKDADPDIPILKEAKAEYANLQ